MTLKMVLERLLMQRFEGRVQLFYTLSTKNAIQKSFNKILKLNIDVVFLKLLCSEIIRVGNAEKLTFDWAIIFLNFLKDIGDSAQ